MRPRSNAASFASSTTRMNPSEAFVETVVANGVTVSAIDCALRARHLPSRRLLR